MAITAINECTSLLHQAMRAIGQDFLGLQICELGNQRVKGWGAMVNSRAVFAVAGAERHVALDWNGQDGSVQIDLGKQIPRGLLRKLGRFDVVTNFGTSEHVDSSPESQRNCFATIHKLCRLGGAMVHYVPMTGTCRGHGVWKYSHEFFEELAESNQYDVIELDDRFKFNRRVRRGESQTDRYMCAVLVKRHDGPFASTFVNPSRK